jgi:hypothetical protein
LIPRRLNEQSRAAHPLPTAAAPGGRPAPASASCATRSPTWTGASACSKEEAEIELRALSPAAVDSGPDEALGALLARIPDLSHALRQAPPELKRRVFDAFCLRISYDKPARRIEISATVSAGLCAVRPAQARLLL